MPRFCFFCAYCLSAAVPAQKNGAFQDSYLVRGTGKSPCRNKIESAPRGMCAQHSYFTPVLEINGFSRSYFTYCCVRCRILSGLSDPCLGAHWATPLQGSVEGVTPPTGSRCLVPTDLFSKTISSRLFAQFAQFPRQMSELYHIFSPMAQLRIFDFRFFDLRLHLAIC